MPRFKTVATLSALALACSAAAVASPMALAAGPGETGIVTVNKVDNNNVTAYSMYQIFTAEVEDDRIATEIDWAGSTDAAKTAMKNAVEGAIRQVDSTYSGTTASAAAAYIAEHAAGHSTAVDDPRIAHGTLLDRLAAAVETSGATATELTPGTAKSGIPEGYVLIVAKTLASVDATGTSPIFAVVQSGNPVIVTEKTTVPVLVKQVKENSTGAWQNRDDAQTKEAVDFRFAGTVSANIASYETYSYTFTDVMTNMQLVTAGADFAESDITVKLGTEIGGGTAISADKFVATYDKTTRTLTVHFDNLKAAGTITKDSVITVEYKAALDTTAVVGEPGNPNTVTLTYSNNPEVASSTGSTPPATTVTHTYEVDVYKYDKNTREPLANATFGIFKEESCTTPLALTAESGYFSIDPAGSLTVMTTDASGKAALHGLDAGTYYIKEISAPSGYLPMTEPVKIVITTPLEEVSGSVVYNASHYAAAVTGGRTGYVNPASSTVAGDDGAAGKTSIDISDDKAIFLPLTGGVGVYVAGFAFLAVAGAAAYVIAKRRKSSTDDAVA